MVLAAIRDACGEHVPPSWSNSHKVWAFEWVERMTIDVGEAVIPVIFEIARATDELDHFW
jgi:hypothetical protein